MWVCSGGKYTGPCGVDCAKPWIVLCPEPAPAMARTVMQSISRTSDINVLQGADNIERTLLRQSRPPKILDYWVNSWLVALPDISNNAGSVKLFLGRTPSSTLKSGLFCRVSVGPVSMTTARF